MSAKKSKRLRAARALDGESSDAGAGPARPAKAAPQKPAAAPVSLFGPSEGHSNKAGPTSRAHRWLVFGMIAVAWFLGFGMRALWLSDGAKLPQSTFDEHRLLTTADAYYYASGVKYEVTGQPAGNPRVPQIDENILIAVTVAAVALFDLPVEDACLWMPAIIAPLVAVPLVLLGLLFGQLAWGFLASLIAVLGFSYWNRSVPGYFDTDMVTITYVVGVMVLVIAGFWRRRALFGTFAALLVVAAPYMHPGSERVLAALTLGTFGYAIVFERLQPHAYRITLALLIAFLPLPFWLRLIAISALELAFARVRVPLWTLVSAAGLVLAVVLWKSRSMDLVLGALGIHLPDVHRSPGERVDIHFPGVASTVAELANPTFDKLGERVAGGTLLLGTAVVGYLAACWRYRPLLLLAPLLALGTVLAVGGQRYTIFAVPVAALGNIWLMLIIGRAVARFVRRRQRATELAVAGLLSPLAIGPAVAHGLEYPARTALATPEAVLLDTLSTRVEPGDFLIGWWDYSYGAWYHAHVTTLVDGTKQNQDLWVAAEVMFTPSQREAAGLARLAVEEQVKSRPLDAVIDDVLLNWTSESGKPVSDFIPALREGRVALPPPTRQIFFYIPWRIIQILPNVARLRPAKGLVPDDELRQSVFIVMNQTRPNGTPTSSSGWTHDPEQQILISSRGERVKVWRVTDVFTDGSGRVRSRDTTAHPDGKVCVVNIKHSNMVLFMDRALYESTLSQLLFLVRPDPSLFEAIAYTNGGVVYRVLP